MANLLMRFAESGAEVLLFNPRAHSWDEHFCWQNDSFDLLGKTPAGRATVEVLNLNDELRSGAKKLWFETGLLP